MIHPSCMAEGRLADILADYARRKRIFLLSEVLAEADRKNTIPETAAALWPQFTALDLVTERVPGDLRLWQKAPSAPRIITPDERIRLEAFFGDPELPSWISDAILDYIQIKTGKAWDDPGVLQKVQRAIVSQKDEYWKEGQKKRISYKKGYSVLGYLAYQALVYILQAEHILFELALAGLLKKSMRILDLGTGPGIVPLAIVDFLGRIGGCTADIYSVEQSEEFIEAFRFLAGTKVPGGDSITIHPPLQSDLSTVPPYDLPPSLDLIVFQNVLNEMTGLTVPEKGGLVRECAKALSSDGSIILVEPADMVNSMDLRRVAHNAAGEGLFIHAPCRFLWGTRCNPEQCWSFVKKPPIRQTSLMEMLSRGDEGFRYRNTDIKYSYSLLRKGPPPPIRGLPLSPRRYARLSMLERHINRKINVAAVVMSGNLGDRRTYVYRICDGTTKRPVYAVLLAYHRSIENKELLSLPYGSIATFTSVLVRFNPKYKAYNLLVTRDSRVGLLSMENAGGHARGRRSKGKKG